MSFLIMFNLFLLVILALGYEPFDLVLSIHVLKAPYEVRKGKTKT